LHSVWNEALKYLFERDLFGWHEQHETEDGLHRRDLVCRILPNAEVWRLMLTDLKSRYVIFEFKNYSEPITQSEIITTERYLYPPISTSSTCDHYFSPRMLALSNTSDPGRHARKREALDFAQGG